MTNHNNHKSQKSVGKNKNTWISFLFDQTYITKMNTINMTLFSNTSINLMNKTGIHMTCIFIGRLLAGKQVTQLQEANYIIQQYLEKLVNLGITLEFDRFDYFPPNSNKKKLLVALYKPNKQLKKWNLDFRIALSKLGMCSYIDDSFLAHITMGKIKKSLGDNELPNLETLEQYPDLKLTGLVLHGQPNKYIQIGN